MLSVCYADIYLETTHMDHDVEKFFKVPIHTTPRSISRASWRIPTDDSHR